MPPPLRCPRCQEPVVPSERADEATRCPRCQAAVPIPAVPVTPQSPTPAAGLPELEPESGPGLVRCPGCGAALPEQCRVCPNCEQILGAGSKETWLDQVKEGLVGENPHAEGLLRAAAVLGAVYVSVLVALGVGILLSQIVPNFGPLLGFLLFICLLIGFLVLVLKVLVPEPTRRSNFPPKARQGILLVLVVAGLVCTVLLVSILALVVFFFVACACTRGRF